MIRWQLLIFAYKTKTPLSISWCSVYMQEKHGIVASSRPEYNWMDLDGWTSSQGRDWYPASIFGLTACRCWGALAAPHDAKANLGVSFGCPQ
jgi:hypothetical protein